MLAHKRIQRDCSNYVKLHKPSDCCTGYSRLSLMRASAVRNCQFTVPTRFLLLFHEAEDGPCLLAFQSATKEEADEACVQEEKGVRRAGRRANGQELQAILPAGQEQECVSNLLLEPGR